MRPSWITRVLNPVTVVEIREKATQKRKPCEDRSRDGVMNPQSRRRQKLQDARFFLRAQPCQ